ncbi:hypothetical protein D3C71_2227730 [compost metagenome]
MAVAVIDLLEVIDIEHGEAQWLAFTSRSVTAVVEQLQDMRMVVQAREAVANHACLEVARP